MALTKISRSLLDTGVSDSSDATAITISSSEQVMIGTTDAGYPDYGDSLTVADVDGGGGNAGMTIRSGTSSYGTFYFSDATGTAAGTYAGKMQYNHSTNSMVFATNSSDRLTIDSSGNVLVGTTTINTGTLGTSNTFLEVAAGTNSGSGTIILSRTTTGNDNEVGGLRFVNSDNADDDGLDADGKLVAAVSARSVTSDSNAGDDSGANLVFYTKPEAGNYAERMRITSTGVLALGKTSDDSTTAGVWIRKHPTGGHGQIMCAGTGSSAYEGLYVRDITNSEMEFMASFHGTVYYRTLSPLSDERKKDNIKDITFGLDAVKELRPVSFDWKNNKGNDQLGFIAQEVEATSLKQLVGTYNDENIEDLRTLNKEGLIPVLVKAIQELSAKVEELESKINE